MLLQPAAHISKGTAPAELFGILSTVKNVKLNALRMFSAGLAGATNVQFKKC
jgi:hypothetical protein